MYSGGENRVSRRIDKITTILLPKKCPVTISRALFEDRQWITAENLSPRTSDPALIPHYPPAELGSKQQLVPFWGCYPSYGYYQRIGIESARSQKIARFYATPSKTMSLRTYPGHSGKILKYRIVMNKDIQRQVAHLARTAAKNNPARIFIYLLRDFEYESKLPWRLRGTNDSWKNSHWIKSVIKEVRSYEILPKHKIQFIRVDGYFHANTRRYTEKVYTPLQKTRLADLMRSDFPPNTRLGALDKMQYAIKLQLLQGAKTVFTHSNCFEGSGIDTLELVEQMYLNRRAADLRKLRFNSSSAARLPPMRLRIKVNVSNRDPKIYSAFLMKSKLVKKFKHMFGIRNIDIQVTKVGFKWFMQDPKTGELADMLMFGARKYCLARAKKL